MRKRFSHRLIAISLISGLALLAAWELWETSDLSVSRKAEPTSSVRSAVTKPASASLPEKLYTVKGRVVAISTSSLKIKYRADSLSKEMILITPRPVEVKPGDDVRVWYAMDGAGPVVKGVITMNEMLDPKGERSATSKDLR
jgi:hypothetical protein